MSNSYTKLLACYQRTDKTENVKPDNSDFMMSYSEMQTLKKFEMVWLKEIEDMRIINFDDISLIDFEHKRLSELESVKFVSMCED